jgi:hypothetical protein
MQRVKKCRGSDALVRELQYSGSPYVPCKGLKSAEAQMLLFLRYNIQASGHTDGYILPCYCILSSLLSYQALGCDVVKREYLTKLTVGRSSSD